MSEDAGRVMALFTAALQLPVAQRAAYLDRECAGDEECRGRVEALLKAHERAGDFLEEPPLEVWPEDESEEDSDDQNHSGGKNDDS